MAVVPGIMWIGGYHSVGGTPGVNANCDGVLGSTLRTFLDRDVMRLVPDDPTSGVSSGPPTANSISCWPWYDMSTGSSHVVASSTTTTVTVSPSPAWTTNEWAGRQMRVCNTAPIPGVGFSQRTEIISNTVDTVTFAAMTAPTVGAVFVLGRGRFTDYHPAEGYLDLSEIGNPSTRTGSAPLTGGAGVGPDATLIRRLFEDVYSEAPYFHLVKYPSTSLACTGWADSPNNAARAGFLLEMARIAAAATAHSNTIRWDHCIIDVSMADLIGALSNPLIPFLYETRLGEMVTWLRSSAVLNNADCKIVLVNHDERLWSVSAPAASHYWRGLHRSFAANNDGVSIVDMNGARMARQIVSVDVGTTEFKYYAQAEYFDMGDKLSAEIARLNVGAPAEAGNGFPLYYLIGDSINVGPATVPWVLASNSTLISGPTVGSLVRPSNQLILNHGTGVLEVYEPGVNSNTAGTLSATSGPELAIMAQLGILHPGGFGLVKVAVNGSALATEAAAWTGTGGGRWKKSINEAYAVLLECRDEAIAYINTALDKQADCRGVMVSLGHNDHTQDGGGQAFADELPLFCDDLREDLTTRTSGANFVISWRRPQLTSQSVDTVEMGLVRDALLAQSELDTQFVVVDVDDLERDRGDNLHETPDSSIEDGERHVAAQQAVSI